MGHGQAQSEWDRYLAVPDSLMIARQQVFLASLTYSTIKVKFTMKHSSQECIIIHVDLSFGEQFVLEE